MAGERQHFLPRFLQRGFASQVQGDKIFTWVYRKDKPVSELNTSYVGVGRKFYTIDGDSEVDDMITDAENNTFAHLVKQLRESDVGPIETGSIPELLAHLEASSRLLRQVFVRAGDYLAARLIDFFEDRDAEPLSQSELDDIVEEIINLAFTTGVREVSGEQPRNCGSD